MRVMSYDRLFVTERLHTGTWIFSDLDRLGFWELELAAAYYRRLADAGARVLNDPARFLHRGSLLKRLHRAGMNAFGAWRPADGERPDAWPVFLRTEAAHRGTLSELIDTPEMLAAEIECVLAAGTPLRSLLVVQYCAEPIADKPGAFRKYAAYVAGDRIVPAPVVTDTHWCAKYGVVGTATEEHYVFERNYNRERPHTDHLLAAARLCGVDFGRIDYGVVDGRVQIYEINTNPHIRPATKHHSLTRLETDRATNRELIEAVGALDASGGVIGLERELPKLPPHRYVPRFARRLLARAARLQFSRWIY